MEHNKIKIFNTVKNILLQKFYAIIQIKTIINKITRLLKI